MSTQVVLRHRTRYSYERAVQLSPQLIRLRPAPHTRTPIHSYRLDVAPDDHFINWQQDPFGNFQARLVFPRPVKDLSIHVKLVAELLPQNPFDFFLEAYADHYPFTYDDYLYKALSPYLEVAEDNQAIRQYVTDFLAGAQVAETPTVEWLVALNQSVATDIDYNVRMEAGVQECRVTLERRNGSCRDSAWLLVQLLRHCGLAARFVSGYLIQTVDGKDLPDLHAWAEVYLPGAGWVGLDATSGLLAGEGHIPLVATPEPSGAAPLSGSSEPAGVTFDFDISTERLAGNI